MNFGASLPTADILAVFTEEITAHGGSVTDTFHDSRRLFTRSVLARAADVRPGDRLQAGVALKATECEVWVHPYTFRQVCRNGAIVAQALATEHLAGLDLRDAAEAAEAIREAVALCCREEAFSTAVRHMRSASETQADLALNLLPLLSGTAVARNRQLVSQIMDQFFRESDRSRFGLAQAVTAVARDTRDPELRWDLEELGGAILAGRTPVPSSGGAAARPPELVAVG